MNFKKRLHKDTSLLFDEQPQQAMLPKDAFDFCKVEDVTDCQELLKHVSSMLDDGTNSQESKGFFSGVAKIFSGSSA